MEFVNIKENDRNASQGLHGKIQYDELLIGGDWQVNWC